MQAAVIGNSSYSAIPLANAARDAATVAEALANVGFEVRAYFDLERDEIDSALGEISEQFSAADISLLYYAGHAFQFNGENRLLAVDLSTLTEEDVLAKSFSLREVLTAIGGPDGAGGGLRLLLVDACRDDPFSQVDDAFSRGIAFEESGRTETLIAYSTSAGELAFDGPAGGNGPYALALTQALQRENPTVSEVLRMVRRDVRVATQGIQIPWVVGSIESDPILGTRRSDAEALLPLREGNVPGLDAIVWQFVRSDLTEDTLSEYALNFPNSPFASEANQRVRQIRTERDGLSEQRGVAETGPSSATLRDLAAARQQMFSEVGFRPDSNLPVELFRIWPRELPPTAAGLRSIVTRCDTLAADPADPQRMAPPVRDGLVNVREAARACGFALARDPDNSRLLFQFGRVLQIAGRHDWARDYYLRASAHEYSAALTNLGFMAIQGIGQDRDLAAAAEFYQQAAMLGNLRARTNLGTMYIQGNGLPELPEEGVLWYRLAAAMGWANAQNALADLYRRGIGVDTDPQAAVAIYQLAAANGQRAAMNNLGAAYLAGLGVQRDEHIAVLWFERAIAEGDRFAPRNLARHLMQRDVGASDPARIVSLLEMAANRGERRAFMDLAELYLSGDFAAQDIQSAYRYARLAEFASVNRSEALAADLRGRLAPEFVERIDADLAQQQRLNGL